MYIYIYIYYKWFLPSSAGTGASVVVVGKVVVGVVVGGVGGRVARNDKTEKS